MCWEMRCYIWNSSWLTYIRSRCFRPVNRRNRIAVEVVLLVSIYYLFFKKKSKLLNLFQRYSYCKEVVGKLSSVCRYRGPTFQHRHYHHQHPQVHQHPDCLLFCEFFFSLSFFFFSELLVHDYCWAPLCFPAVGEHHGQFRVPARPRRWETPRLDGRLCEPVAEGSKPQMPIH